MEVLLSLISFIVAVGVLITVHEFGHFWVARRLGVKVLRFSIGFGRPLWRTRRGADDTEFVLAMLPLGGYVKMLDEREGDVAGEELGRAFNRQSLAVRSAVVAAGPLFNFLFAVIAYWAMFVLGVGGLRPLVGEVVPESPAAVAGLETRDEILAVDGRRTPTWDAAVLALLDGALERRRLELEVQSDADGKRRLYLDLAATRDVLGEGELLERLGLRPWRPPLPAVLERVVAGGAAERAGLRGGDRIVTANGEPVDDWGHWVAYVRARPGEDILVGIERGGAPLELLLRPAAVPGDDGPVGRIGAYVRIPEPDASLRAEVRYGPLAALGRALAKTGEMSGLTLRTLWQMLRGRASVENIGGPISIARYAGQSAGLGLSYFLGFLGLISISLGILNLLPVPVLDGGHLLYYLMELLKGGPLSERTQMFGQRVGIALLLALMALAFYNDLVRLLR